MVRMKTLHKGNISLKVPTKVAAKNPQDIAFAVDNFAPKETNYLRAAAVYSTKLENSWYHGAIMRVRRSSDNAEKDIYPDAEGSISANLKKFVGSGNGYVSIWYDQSGHGNSAIQTTTTNQPMIVGAGMVKDGVHFTRTSSHYLTIADSPSVDIVTHPLSVVFEAHATNTTTGYLLSRNDNASANMQYGVHIKSNSADEVTILASDMNVFTMSGNIDYRSVVYSLDNGKYAGYIEGEQQTIGSKDLSAVTSRTYMQIGAMKTTASYNSFYGGDIRNIIIVKGMLDLADAKTLLYNKELFAAWKLDLNPPTPGGGGTITASNVKAVKLTLSWTAATDDVTPQSFLQYKVVRSLSNNISTVDDAESNGTTVQDWVTNITSVTATGLSNNTLYYFNVLVQDLASNKAVYNMTSQATQNDVTPPTPGDGGAISATNIQYYSVDLDWTTATDDISDPGDLEYKTVYSLSNNVTSVTAAETNGTIVQDWTAAVTSVSATGLSIDTTYYFNVLVKDEVSNKAAYTSISQATTADVTPPTPGDGGTITPFDVQYHDITLTWVTATDDVTTAGALRYRAYKSSSNNITSVTAVTANGTAINNWTTAIALITATGLTVNTTYYFNVLVEDEASNIAAYTMLQQATTADVTPPTPGDSGTLTVDSVNYHDIDFSWTTATDDETTADMLQYRAYKSVLDNISGVTAAEANGTAIIDWTTAVTSVTAIGLTINTTYYLNVLVKDRSDNKAAYTSIAQATSADVTPPTPGGGGTITPTTVAYHSIDLGWVTATDDETTADALRYRVYKSGSNNITSVSAVLDNGVAINDWTTALVATSATSLNINTTYYFNVLVKDEASNIAAYTMLQQATSADVTPPVPGGGGTITPGTVDYHSVGLSWVSATDDETTADSLQYKVYYSTSDNISGTTAAQANGTTAVNWTTAIVTATVSGLAISTTYYFNILVVDRSSNVAAYTSLQQATSADTTPPVPGNSGIIVPGTTTATNIAFSWTSASDDATTADSLQYKAYYSVADNISGVTAAQTNGTTAVNWTTAITAATATELSPDTIYYFNVLVIDESSNIAAYTSTSHSTTADTIPPVPGGGGTITPTNETMTSVDLSWTAGTDNVTPQANLTYKVYYSTSDNISGVTAVETNGTTAVGWTTALVATTVTGLSAGIAYYFNVLIQDLSANKAAYTSVQQATSADTTPPVPGNGGTITASDVSYHTISLNWTTATDNYTTSDHLQYRTYKSNSNNVTSVTAVEDNGTAIIDWTTAITSVTATGLTINTTYYFNVLVQDASSNKAAYTMVAQATSADTTPPAPGGGGTITVSGVQATCVSLAWVTATDDETSAGALQYKTYYSTSADISGVTAAQNNGTTAVDWTIAAITAIVSGLSPSTTYYFNVLVIDEASNIAAYTMATGATSADVTPPTPGGGGTITPFSVTATNIPFSWVTATDDVVTVGLLQYRAYKSDLDNISGVTAVEANGTALAGWATAIIETTAAGLTPSTTYYFNVLVQDLSANKAAYTSLQYSTTADTVPPTPGDSGTITPGAVTATNIAISWTTATDNVTLPENLTYAVYYSTSNNITSVTAAEANGTTAVNWTTAITAATAVSLSPGTTYYFNVLVQDLSANKAAYTSVSQSTTADTTPPVPGDSGTITVGAVTATNIALSWTTGTDNVTLPGNLRYKGYYSISADISGVTAIEANGTTAVNWTTAITSVTATGLTPSTTYYFNVLIQDASSNKAAYIMVTGATTADTTPPTPGSGGVMTASDTTPTSIGLTWVAATDNVTPQASLQYKVYRSASADISGVTAVEANGTTAVNWTTAITTATLTGLSASTTYYLNTIVQDASSNKAAYIMATATTTAASDPPVPGNSGILTATTLTNTSITLTWTTATDDATTAGALKYKVYYSTSDNISGATAVEANGTTAVNWTTAITAATISGLTSATMYYTNVLVMDNSVNKVAYMSTSIRTAIVYDTFDRADASALGTSDTGQVWGILTGMPTPKGLYIRSNYAVGIQSNYQFSVIPSSKSNVRLKVTVVEKKTYGGMVFRATSWSYNFTLWYGGGYTQYHLYEVGGAGLLGVSAINPADGDIIEVVCSGTSIKVYINSVLALDFTRSFNQTVTSHGLITVDNAGTKYNNYGVVEI